MRQLCVERDNAAAVRAENSAAAQLTDPLSKQPCLLPPASSMCEHTPRLPLCPSCRPQALPPSLTLSLCYLACWQAREAVGPLDVIRWALNGQLPYLRLAAESRDAMEAFAGVLPLHFLDPRGGCMWRAGSGWVC